MTPDSVEELVELLNQLRSFGVIKYQCGDFKVVLAPDRPIYSSGTKEKEDTSDPMPSEKGGDIFTPFGLKGFNRQ